MDATNAVNIPIWAWATFVGVAVLVTPFVAFHKVRIQRDKLQERARPLLGFDRTDEPRHGARGYSFGLVVRNNGQEPAEDCVGKLAGLECQYPDDDAWTLERLPKNHALLWREESAIGSFGSFSVAGNQMATLEIFTAENVPLRIQQVSVGYVGTEEYRANHSLSLNLTPILIAISVASKGADPVYAVCQFNAEIDHKGFYWELLAPIGDITEEPNLNDYRQMLVANTQASRSESV